MAISTLSFFQHRMVLSPGSENQTDFNLQKTTLKEGEMWGRNISNLNKWVDGDGNIVVKFIIFIFTFNFLFAYFK